MRKIILIYFFTINISWCNLPNEVDIIKNIEYGYTTRWDIEQKIGKGEYIPKKLTYPDCETDKSSSLVRCTGLYYSELGITFLCDEYDNEYISSIQFRKPYEGKFGLSKSIKIGITKLGDIFKKLDTLKVSTTGASNYYEFEVEQYKFYIEKPDSHKNKIGWDDVPKYIDNLHFYKNQVINTINIDLRNYNNLKINNYIISSDFEYFIPKYAPKNEKHLNCIEFGWPKSISLVLISFYALTGGGKSEKIKQRYWKEYYPNHKIKYEGYFKNNNKSGIFKYYNFNGNLIKKVDYGNKEINYLYYFFSLSILLTIIFIILKKKIPKSKSEVGRENQKRQSDY